MTAFPDRWGATSYGRTPSVSTGGRSVRISSPVLGRRQFLGIVGSSLLLAACSPTGPNIQPKPVHTIDTLLTETPFYIAHRGSGDNWVEHSLDAYTHAIAAGAKAIEISVCSTSDGYLVCHHDTTTVDPATGADTDIALTSLAELSRRRTDARAWLGPAAAPQPIPLLSTVLDRFAATHVIFLEDKQGTNTKALLKMMASYPDPTSHFVWKQWAAAHQHLSAASKGYKTWGYFTPELYPRAAQLSQGFDYLGVYHTDSEADIASVVALGKPVIAWEIHYRYMRDRMQRLGVLGMMCSNLPYVTTELARGGQDRFGTGYRSAGDLPWTTDLGYRLQPVIDATAASVTIAAANVQSYLMGSLGPIADPQYSIEFDMRWPLALPDTLQHGGIAFGCNDDAPYRVGTVSETGGMHVVLRANGSLELYRRAAGQMSGMRLASVMTDVPVVGEWVRIRVEVGSSTLRAQRLVQGAPVWQAQTNTVATGGGYLWLCKNYPEKVPIQFRRISILP